MQGTTIKRTLLAFILASALPLAACSDDDTPTSPTQPGPPVGETPAPPPPPPPEPEPPPPPPTDDRPIVTISGGVFNLNRHGAGDLDVDFRINDDTIVRAAGGTPVVSGGTTFNTDAIRNGQTVTVQGRRTNGFLDATRVEIIAQAP
jgi:hypothetical protein